MPDDTGDGVVAELWGDYKQRPTADARERLILHYAPLVKFVAGRVATGLPHSIEQADLVSYGIFGLIDAIEKFDPARGFKFETYAISRVKGAIIDELRSIDWVPRSVRAKSRSIEHAYSKLENELRRTPDDAELADERRAAGRRGPPHRSGAGRGRGAALTSPGPRVAGPERPGAKAPRQRRLWRPLPQEPEPATATK